ncbi:hypothetical protein Hanom_Chr07g00677581 [Helianthus anomalus]
MASRHGSRYHHVSISLLVLITRKGIVRLIRKVVSLNQDNHNQNWLRKILHQIE